MEVFELDPALVELAAAADPFGQDPGPGLEINHQVRPDHAAVEERVLALTAHVAEGARRLGCEITSPLSEGQRSAIICCRHPRVSADEIVAHLSGRGIAAARRLGSVRLSPHFYNTEDELDRALAAVGECL